MKKRLFAVAATALLPALGMLAYNELAFRQARVAEINGQVLQASRQVASEMDRTIDGLETLLIAVSSIPAVRQPGTPACHDALAAVTARVRSVRTILVLGPDGKLLCDSLGAPVGLDFSERQHFKDAIAGKELAVGIYTKSKLSGSPVLPIAIPLKDEKGAITGVLATAIQLQWLGERLKERGLPAGAALTIADRDGVIIARNPLPERFVGTRIPEAFQSLVNAAEPGTQEVTSQDGTIRILGYQPASPLTHGLYISSSVSRDEAFAPIDRSSLAGALLTLAGIILAAGATWFVGNVFIRRPIHKIVGTVDAWRTGMLDRRTGMRSSQGELETVGEALDQLLDELALRQSATRNAEDHRDLLMRELSHRVKNTLAVVAAMANQTFRGSEDRRRVGEFTQRLTALSGAYDVLTAGDWSKADMRSVIETTLKPHRAATEHPFRLEGPDLSLPPEAVVALSLVIHELATNAVKYGALKQDNGHILINWNVPPDAGNRVHLTWDEFTKAAVSAPLNEGFGSKLIKRAFPEVLAPQIKIAFAADGLRFSLAFDIA